MSKRMKMDNRKWLEAVYDDIAKVLQRTPYMTPLEVQAVLDAVKTPKGIQAKPEAWRLAVLSVRSTRDKH